MSSSKIIIPDDAVFECFDACMSDDDRAEAMAQICEHFRTHGVAISMHVTNKDFMEYAIKRPEMDENAAARHMILSRFRFIGSHPELIKSINLRGKNGSAKVASIYMRSDPSYGCDNITSSESTLAVDLTLDPKHFDFCVVDRKNDDGTPDGKKIICTARNFTTVDHIIEDGVETVKHTNLSFSMIQMSLDGIFTNVLGICPDGVSIYDGSIVLQMNYCMPASYCADAIHEHLRRRIERERERERLLDQPEVDAEAV